jgi:VIT1/CCC1 family predicted Fe2+/Mn2+ transporter
MRTAVKKGLSFGLTSGIITTLGLIVGLNSGTRSQMVIISGILTIAIADSLSDALGIHISEESKGDQKHKQVWEATLFTFIGKFLFGLSFLIPILVFDLNTAIIVSVIWGILLLSVSSFYIARQNSDSPWKVIVEHLIIAALVIVATHYTGEWINSLTS